MQVEVDVDEVLVEVHQLLLQEQGTFSCSLCFSVQQHLFDVDLLDERVCGLTALHSWYSVHHHVLGQSQKITLLRVIPTMTFETMTWWGSTAC